MKDRSQDWAVGKPAPPLSLPLAAGGRVSLTEFGGRAVLLSFLSHAA